MSSDLPAQVDEPLVVSTADDTRSSLTQGCGGYPRSPSLTQHGTLDAGPLPLGRRGRRASPYPTDAPWRPVAQPRDRHDVLLGDGTDQPRVDALGRVVALDPPAVL